MASLESLPAEIIILIANHIKAAKCPLTPLAVTSKRYQTHVEPIIFSHLSIRTAELPIFTRMLARPGRFLALRRLTYEFDDLPESYHSSHRISEERRAAYSVAFTTAIRDLLVVLEQKSSSSVGASHPGISLNLRGPWRHNRWEYGGAIYLDGSETGVVEDDEITQSSDEADDEPGFEASLTRAWLKLTEDALPVVPCVTTLRNQDGFLSILLEHVWPQSWTALASYLPSITKVEMNAFDDERKASRSREEARNTFGLSLSSLSSTVTDVSLRYLNYPPGNQFRDPPRLNDHQLGYDIFSHELGLLSQRLVRLELIDATINLVEFFTCSTQTEWPRLEDLEFRSLGIHCPDGTWYFQTDPREDEYEGDEHAQTLDDMREQMQEIDLPAAMDVPSHIFRTTMEPEKFNDIYLAAAHAVKRMPKLRRLEIEFDVQARTSRGGTYHEFYYSLDKEKFWFPESSADIQVGWGMLCGAGIDNEVLEAWREVGNFKNALIELCLADTSVGIMCFKPIS